MTALPEFDSVRSTADTKSIFDDRTIPAGMRGAGTRNLARRRHPRRLRLHTADGDGDGDGDFVQGVLTECQYEIIQA
jgi:hypothetical protein